ncbi:spore coat U domain-containing protein [Alcanivorax sp. DP30]|uniref:Csu type fimbrial protein n=1 Tax=Alcanivorax sp. DP30 TaxID=2606217 RepID=UPI0013696038|nr:spore coat U domain-containing protein [Alcanivorax sp. DP30]MZR62338.1 fimbrial major subunit CsuA/B family protein [Alcanivorax sp. DP30]
MKRLLFLFILVVSPLTQVKALQCSIDNSPILDFGSKDPFVGGNVTANTSIQWSCSRGVFEGGFFGFNFTMCINVAADGNGGVFPRNMTPTNPGPSIPFNVHPSPAGSTVIQPTLNAIAVPVSFGFLETQDSGTATAFGIAPGPMPSTVLAEVHNASMVNSQIRGVNVGQSCNTASTLLGSYTLDATIEIPDQCRITANDLDFGTQSAPLAQTDSETFIDVRCTNASPFTVGLSNGQNPSGGSRRMSDGSNFVSYGLFQDAARSQEWDSTSNRQAGSGLGTGSSIMMTVFGRIPADPTAVQGSYSDTVTVDIVF